MDHDNATAVAIFILTVAAVFFWSRLKRTSVKVVRGPSSPSILFGHERVLRNQSNFGELEMQWASDYGAVYRIGGCFAQDILVISDPAALGYIFSSYPSGNRFPKTKDSAFLLSLLLGQGLVSVEGESHRRQRKIINLAFSHSQLQRLQLRFQDSSEKLVGVVKDSLDTGATVFNVLDWTGKAAMDIIGQSECYVPFYKNSNITHLAAIFQYDLCSLDEKKNELRDALRTVFVDSQSNRSSLEFIYVSLIRLVPDTLLKFLKNFSTRETRHLSNVGDMVKHVARKASSRGMGDDDEGKRDLVDVLGRARATGQMDDNEVEAQFSTFVFAGHETIATTLGWLLYELAAHPEDQNKIREEILQSQLQNQKFSSTEYDSMIFLNATIKEVLRLHPIAPTLMRRAVQDECLPLSEPIITRDGKVLKYIPIPKGQTLLCSIYTYNRLPSIWGSEAGQWNPNRFMDDRTKPPASLGIYANLMSFGSGMRSCIGWQFAIMEMQVTLVDLLKHFNFSLPEGLNLQEFPAGPVIVPVVEGKASQGAQIPLRVSFLG
ncbi:cytochrome P450 [Armillaria novae-zelandiae]|uniref:Cytochrome P450 n=1 Tax=Armillaria novae-zelandiae TaxID=153914 RepID=A0AA39N840_9AGAR|nr:cytochrome P450 [Armillaria novae-zelandiae]